MSEADFWFWYILGCILITIYGVYEIQKFNITIRFLILGGYTVLSVIAAFFIK